MQRELTYETMVDKAIELSAMKEDYVCSSDALHMKHVAPTSRQEVIDPRWPNSSLKLSIGDHGDFNIKSNAHSQIASRLDIPKKYYDRMKSVAPELLCRNVNNWLEDSPTKRLVRTYGRDSGARAVLSDRYRCFDNSDLLQVVLKQCLDAGLVVKNANITDDRLYLNVVHPELRGEVKVGDVVEYGIAFSNSEVGLESWSMKDYLHRLACLNGMVSETVFRQVHIGRSSGKNIGMGETTEYWSEATHRLDDAALYSKVKDTLDALLNKSNFEKKLEELRFAAARDITGDVDKAIDKTCKRLEINEAEKAGVLRSMITGGDLSQWGLANAITAQAHQAASYDRAIEFQRAGGKVIALSNSEWKEIAESA